MKLEEEVEKEKDLGIVCDNRLQLEQHVSDCTTKDWSHQKIFKVFG